MIPLFKVYMDKSVDEPLLRTLHSGFVTQGPMVQKFEQALAQRFYNSRVLTLAAGTHGLHLALRLAGIGAGDEVITTPLTCTASNWPILMQGATPVWADVKSDFNIDPASVATKVTERTKAILCVHWGGYPCDMDELHEIAVKHRLFLIEDAAHAYGSVYKGHPIGSCSHSDFVMMSFQAIKHLTCFPPQTRIVRKPDCVGKGGIGARPIERLKIGDDVLTYNHKTAAKEWKPVTELFERDYNGEMVTIKLSNGNELKMTEDHPVWSVKHNSYIPAQKLAAGDKMIQFKYQGWNKIKRDKAAYKEFCDKMAAVAAKPEFKAKQSVAGLKRFSDPTEREKAAARGRQRYADPAERSRQSRIAKKFMQRKSFWENCVQGMKSSGRFVKSGPEAQLEEMLNKLLPSEFRFNGDGSEGVFLNGACPDFVNVNGKKKVIELFGKHWHSEELRGKSVAAQKRERVARFKKVGWECLVVMEQELNNAAKLEAKLLNFSVNPNCEVVVVVSVSKSHYEGKVYNIETADNHNYFAYGLLVHNCVDGGALFLGSNSFYERGKLLRWYGIDREGPRTDFRCEQPILEWGYKYHMNDVCATIGLCNMEAADRNIAAAIDNANFYNKHLADVPGVTLTQVAADRQSSHWLYTMLVERRSDFCYAMAGHSIAVSRVHERNDIHPCTKEFKAHLPNMESVVRKQICIPVGWWVTAEQREHIVEAIKGGW